MNQDQASRLRWFGIATICGTNPECKGNLPNFIATKGNIPYAIGMEQRIETESGKWLRRRDAWMRMLVGNSFVSRNGKLVGIHVALRLSAKKPYTYPAMKTIGRDLGISTRHVARALKELEVEDWIKVKRQAGRSSVYSLHL